MVSGQFSWGRCSAGYRLRPRPAEPKPALAIEPASEDYETYRPSESALFQIFADAGPSPEGMLDFTNKYGIIDWGGPHLFYDLGFKGELSVDIALRQHEHLRQALGLAEAGDWDALAELYNSENGPYPSRGAIITQLRPRPHGRPELIFVPSGLCQFLWFQFARYVASEATSLFRCDWCNTPFLVGPGTGRRDTAKFCTTACKVAAFRKRQADGGC